MISLGKQDLIDIAHGAIFLGSGGGGSLLPTLQVIQAAVPDGATVDLVSVDEAASDTDALAACCTFVGSQTAARDDANPAGAINAPVCFDKEIARRRYDKKLGYLVPVEMGAQSSVIPCCIIAMAQGWKVVDGDGVGRAVPALPATTYAQELGTSAMVLADFDKLRVLLESLEDEDDDVAPVLRLNQAASGIAAGLPSGVAGLTLWPMQGDELRRVPIAGTVTLALEIGRAMREASGDTGKQGALVPTILELVRNGGYPWAEVIFEGRIKSVRAVSQDYIVVTIEGEKDSAIIYTAGESVIAWRSSTGEPLAMGPDSICYLTPDGRTFSNVGVFGQVNQPVCLVGIAARPEVRKAQIVQQSFTWVRSKLGYPGRYREIESLNDPESPIPGTGESQWKHGLI